MADLTGMLQAAAGAAGAAGEATYIEDVFSTYLYTGTGSARSITNGIDLDGEGGLVWAKSRSAVGNNNLYDTERGVQKLLVSQIASAEDTDANSLTAFNSDGFSLGSSSISNTSATTYASWTFRKAPKFFDVVTYTGNGTTQNIAHNLGSVPGCIIVKKVTGSGSWAVYHRGVSNPETQYLYLNFTSAAVVNSAFWNNTAPTSTEFTVGSATPTNESGQTFVAYLFAHDAGGFGDDAEQNVISCGSYTGNGSATGPAVTLGYEPQYILIKGDVAGGNWLVFDNMRGIPTGGNDSYLLPNLSDGEATGLNNALDLTATGFQITNTSGQVNNSGSTYIYIAIRRGPMKTPESGTDVYQPVYGTGANPSFPSSFTVDGALTLYPSGIAGYPNMSSRLQGERYIATSSTAVEGDWTGTGKWDFQTGFGSSDFSSASWCASLFRRAPGFFDVVCYTGTGVARTVDHNLGVAPEMMIVKNRGATWNWAVYHSALGATKFILLDSSGGPVTQSTVWNDTTPTNSVFTVGSAGYTGASANNYVAYLFATLAGVSKVGSYTGTGTTLAIDCGFSAGARFVMIKRTDSTGDWYVWDSARGISASSDPYILLNSTAAEVTGTDYIDPSSAGFEISSSAPAAINASGGSFVFLAVA